MMAKFLLMAGKPAVLHKKHNLLQIYTHFTTPQAFQFVMPLSFFAETHKLN